MYSCVNPRNENNVRSILKFVFPVTTKQNGKYDCHKVQSIVLHKITKRVVCHFKIVSLLLVARTHL